MNEIPKIDYDGSEQRKARVKPPLPENPPTENMVNGTNPAPPILFLDEGGQVREIMGAAEFSTDRGRNVQKDEIMANMAVNFDRGLRHWMPEPRREGAAIALVGGGTSLPGSVEFLREFSKNPANRIITFNDSLPYLVERGVKVDGNVYWEAETPHKARHFIKGVVPGVKYFLASQAHPSVFEKCIEGGAEICLFTIYYEFDDGWVGRQLKAKYPGAWMAGGGIGGILHWFTIAEAMGFREIHTVAMDSSFGAGGVSHAYYDRQYLDRRRVFMPGSGKFYECNAYLMWQAFDFIWQIPPTVKAGVKVVVHGEGLIPDMARLHGLHAEQQGFAPAPAAVGVAA